MIPTQFGQELLEDSRPILAEWDQLNLKLEESATRHKGKIRLGLSGGLIYFGSKKIWEYFKELHPHTEIEPYEHGYIEGLKCLKAGTLDAVVISDYENTDGFITYSLPSTRRLLIVEKSNPLASKEELEIKDLRNEKFILCINDFAYNKFLRLCQAEGFTPTFAVPATRFTCTSCAVKTACAACASTPIRRIWFPNIRNCGPYHLKTMRFPIR